MSIQKPAPVESPYVTTDTTPTRLASAPAAGGGVSTVAATVSATSSATASVTANTDANTTSSGTGSNVSYYTSGIEGIAGLASSGRVFDGANVYVTLEQQQYNTYNQTFEIGNSISVTGNITTSGGYFIGNGSQLTGIVAISSYGNSNVVANLAALGSNPVSTTGNITGGYILGNGSQLTGIAATYGNANVVANLAALGSNPVSTTGNITSNFFIGNGSQLTGLGATYGNANVVANLAALGSNPVSTTGNVTGGNLTTAGIANVATLAVTGSATVQGSISISSSSTSLSATGNVIAGNVTTGGLISATGNVTSGNVSTGVITLTNGATIRDTSGDSVVFGQNAGLTSQAQHAVAIGINAGRLFQGEDSVAIGYNAGYYDQGRGVAIGWNAGEGGVLFRSVSDAQGGSGPVHNYVSGNGNPTLTLDSVVNVTVNDLVFGNNIPASAYVVSINAPNIAISAPPTAALTAGDDITFVGLQLGINDASNIVLYMRVIGTNIPANTFVQSTGCSFVTLNQYPTAPLVNGASITFNVGQGFGATAVGYQAGENFQDANAVAVGSQAGYDNQGVAAVAVGYLSGYQNQGNAAVAMGWSAGQTTQGLAAVAIGEDAGRTSQGEYSVAIGYQAGFSGQGNNSIVLNATGDVINGITANTFTVTPMRNDVANTANVMFYNATSKEITYGNTISVAGNITGGNILGGANVNATTHTGTTVSVSGNVTGGNINGFMYPSAGTTSVPSLQFTAGSVLNTPAAGVLEYDGTVFYATLKASQRGQLQSQFLRVQVLVHTLSDTTSAQQVFSTPGYVSLAASTTYQFEAVYYITRADGTTSHTTSTLFNASSALLNIAYTADVTTSTGVALTAVNRIYGTATTALVVTAASSSATENLVITLKGIMRTSAATDVTPQFQYSAAPGGAPTVLTNSYIKFIPLGTSSMASVGPWT